MKQKAENDSFASLCEWTGAGTTFEKDRAWVEIDLKNLKENVKWLKTLLPAACRIMGVVKADAYGHGDVAISRALSGLGIMDYAVATVEEGIRLRKAGIRGQILILGMTPPTRFAQLVQWDLTQTVVDYTYAKMLSGQNGVVKGHVKIDTGMGRLGEDWENYEELKKIYQIKNLQITGTFTHLCVADSPASADIQFTQEQIKRFRDVAAKLKNDNIFPGRLHVQSSYGVLNFPDLQFDYARIGIALYGVLSGTQDRRPAALSLRPVLSLKSRVVLVKEIKKGMSVGYGRNFVAAQGCKIAVVSIGYADGIPRSLSCGRGRAIVHGKLVPIIGNVCMDQLMVDITEIQETIQAGDVVTFIGQEGDACIHTEEVADCAGTIANELLSRIGSRVKKVYLEENKITS